VPLKRFVEVGLEQDFVCQGVDCVKLRMEEEEEQEEQED
jgi:hypothetical protein